MKKFILSLILSIVSGLGAFAQEFQTNVVVEFKNGEKLAMALSDRPKAQFDNTDLVLTSARFEGRYATADIQRFYFEDEQVGIKPIRPTDELTEGEVFDTHGRKVSAFKGILDMATLPAGVYVIKTKEGKSFKVTKK